MEMAQTSGGIYVPRGTLQHVDPGAEVALKRHFGGMAKLEMHFPQLVKLAVRVGNAISLMTAEKGLGPQCVMFDAPRWHPSGHIVVRMGFDPEAVRDAGNDKAAKNFSTLKELNEKFPQAVELAMAIAFHLVPAVNNARLDPKTVKIGHPKFALDKNSFTFSVGIPRPEVDL